MRRYWKVAPGEQASEWKSCLEHKCMLLGWEDRDLGKFETYEKMSKVLAKKGYLSGSIRQMWRFAKEIETGDVVIANEGLSKIVGIGSVTGEYLAPRSPNNPGNSSLPHARRVDWLIDQPLSFSSRILNQPTIHEIGREKLSVIEQRYRAEFPNLHSSLDKLFPVDDIPPELSQESDQMDELDDLVQQFKQIILYGPPGTGKTRHATRLAAQLLTGSDELSDEEVSAALRKYRENGRYALVVFHPAYEYEQFVGGIEPATAPTGSGAAITFTTRAGTFLRLCRRASELKPEELVVLVIDEINRGNLPKLLGELVYALEYRGAAVELPMTIEGKAELVIPQNLIVIATMNSADRSIGHIDVAIRRRFGLCHVGPDSAIVRTYWASIGDPETGNKLASLLDNINSVLQEGDGSVALAEHGVGHSYFLPRQGTQGEAARAQIRLKWRHQVVPLLREYGDMLNLTSSLNKYLQESLDELIQQ